MNVEKHTSSKPTPRQGMENFAVYANFWRKNNGVFMVLQANVCIFVLEKAQI